MQSIIDYEKNKISCLRQGKALWTTEQDEIIKSFAGQKTVDEIAIKVGRTRYAVQCRAMRLGISLTIKRKPWTNAEMRILKAQAGKKCSTEIAKELGRTRISVIHKARNLKISLLLKGELCSWAKYPDATVERAREMHDEGIKPKAISKELGVPYWNVCDFIYYKRH